MPALLNPPRPAAASHLVWNRLQESAVALAIAEAAAADERPWVYVAPDTRTLERMRAELQFFGGADLPLLTLPDWEILPYDSFSPHPDIISERLRTLSELPKLRRGVLLVSVESLLARLPPPGYVHGRSFALKRGERLDLAALRLQLIDAGYAACSQVSEPGEFALRGALFDLWPSGANAPVRVDLFDEQIESLRYFDADSQRSLESLQSLDLLPAREVPLDASAVRDFRRRFRERFEGDVLRMEIYRGVSEGLAPPGIEFYLPLFFPQTATLADYLPRDAVLAVPREYERQCESAWQSIVQRHEDRRHDIERPLLAPPEAFVPPDELHHALVNHARVILDDLGSGPAASGAADFATHSAPVFPVEARAPEPLALLVKHLEDFHGRVLIAADSPGRRELISELLSAHGRKPRLVDGWRAFRDGEMRLALTIAEDLSGMALPGAGLLLLTETQLFGQRARQVRRRRRVQADPASILRDLKSLEAGAPVVHENYGVGRYLGLAVMDIGDQPGEFLQLEYRDGDKLYVPVHALHLISRYTGGEGTSAPLHKLGTDQWARVRRRAAEAVRDVAAELLDLHARRQTRAAPALKAGELEYQSFANAFPFEETADQMQAIEAVVKDLAGAVPMDRVVCGDVGFGKTEVALRAAFVAVQAGRQVAVLVPTTLLAEQHAQSFRDRFADWPVRVESLSRFRSGGDSQAVLEGLASGRVDIVIATHRLLHAHARFKNLGLIVVDEEHRFGVRDKERLKTLRAEVHVLTLTATPIPRTLNMALGGLRELSLISTPPVGRLAIKTFVTEWHGPTLRDAALRELRRGGQIYLVHNEVQSIEQIASEFRQLVPEAELRVGHGQMREVELERLMVDFYHRRFNVLACTTIIESGIDVPTANTILINRADKLGLAQLHQLRGRVGRSHHRAYAYLIVPSRKTLTGDAAKRLAAIESMEDLGAGFLLATHDLEIRGAGEFLGEQQSGTVSEVGLSMYLDLLERAVQALRSGRVDALDAPLAAVSEVELHVPALLPADYVADVHLRLSLYQRIAAADAAGIDDLSAELVDRFGVLPPSARNLLQLAHLRLGARALGLTRLDLAAAGGSVQFGETHRVDPAAVIRLLQREPKTYRMDGPQRLRIQHEMDEPEERFAYAQTLYRLLRGERSTQRAS